MTYFEEPAKISLEKYIRSVGVHRCEGDQVISLVKYVFVMASKRR